MDKLEQEQPGLPDSHSPEQSGSQLSLWPAESAPPESLSPAPSQPTPDPDTPWSLGDIGAFVLFAVLSFILVNVVAVVIFLALRHQFSWGITLQQAFTRTPFVLLLQAGWEMLWLFFIYFVITIKYRRGFWEAIKWLRRPRPGLYLAAGVAVAVVANLAFSSEKQLPIERLFSSPQSAYLLAIFGVCVAPFVEELVFRGFFYPVFEKLWGMIPAVFLTAFLFASIHIPQLRGGWREIAGIFFVGAVFSYCRGKTGSLLPPFLMHFAYNAFIFVALYFSTDQFRALRN
ncbi:MAG: CPBP family intramembrane metalloprotease [Acidobacteria bacterium]|nr:CPBP family intramembrane metalloprotease [Acidobacteriota bacterium]